PVVFVCWPAAVPVTFTPNVHESVAGSVAPDKLIVLVPAVAMMIPPPQLPVETAGVDTTSPAGNASLNATPPRGTVLFGFVKVNVSVVEPFNGTVDAPKILLIVGGATTVRVAVLLVAPAPLSAAVIGSGVLFLTPAVVLVTLMLNVQEALAARLVPETLMLPSPAVAVIVPSQVVFSPFGVATDIPAGSASLKLMLVSGEAFGFVSRKSSVVVALTWIWAVPKEFESVGGEIG